MAYTDDGTPAAERTQTPDQQSATGQPGGGGSSVGLMDALQSMQGSIPNEAILGLLQGPSFGQRMGQAAAGGVALMRGVPNPANAIIEQQQKQQLGIVQLLQRMQEQQDLKLYREEGRQDARNLHKQNMLEKYTGDLIASGDSEANLLGWTTRGRQMASAGFPIPPDVIQGLARKDLPPETMKQGVRLVGTVPYPELMAMYRGLRPEHEQFLLKAKESDDYRKGLGLESRFEEQMRSEEFGIKKMAANLATVREERQQAAEERQGKALELSQQKADQQARHQGIMEGLSIQSAERANQALAQGNARLDLAERRLAAQKAEWDRKFETKDDKKKAALDVSEKWLDELESLATKLDNKSYLPKTSAGVLGGLVTGDLSASKAAGTRFLFPHDNDWAEWGKILQGGGVGFERSVLNDMGPRALAAYKGILSFFDNPPTLSAVKQAAKFMHEEIAISRNGKQPADQEVVYKSGGKTFVERWRPGDPLPPDAQILTLDGKPLQ